MLNFFFNDFWLPCSSILLKLVDNTQKISKLDGADLDDLEDLKKINK